MAPAALHACPSCTPHLMRVLPASMARKTVSGTIFFTSTHREKSSLTPFLTLSFDPQGDLGGGEIHGAAVGGGDDERAVRRYVDHFRVEGRVAAGDHAHAPSLVGVQRAPCVARGREPVALEFIERSGQAREQAREQ